MNARWTPDTQAVRDEWVVRGLEAEFDRWLAARDRAVKAEALREAAAQMRECKDPGHWNLRAPRNPETAYSPDVWLERRADRIEKGADQ